MKIIIKLQVRNHNQSSGMQKFENKPKKEKLQLHSHIREKKRHTILNNNSLGI